MKKNIYSSPAIKMLAMSTKVSILTSSEGSTIGSEDLGFNPINPGGENPGTAY